MRIGRSGKVKVGQGDIVRLVGGLIAAITSVHVAPESNAVTGHHVTINALAKTETPNVFNRIAVTPEAIEAVKTESGEWITRTGEPYNEPAPKSFNSIMDENESYAKDHGINIADIGTNRDPGSASYGKGL